MVSKEGVFVARLQQLGRRLAANRCQGLWAYAVDLLLEGNEAVAETALLSARLGARVSRSMHGRQVDVLIDAPKLLRLPIHAVAHAEGVRL